MLLKAFENGSMFSAFTDSVETARRIDLIGAGLGFFLILNGISGFAWSCFSALILAGNSIVRAVLRMPLYRLP